MSSSLTRNDIETFLYEEASLLDSWRLDEWLALFTGTGRYLVPSGDLPEDADPDKTLFYIADDAILLRERVARLHKRNAHAEWPHSKTRHFISNVRIRTEVNEIIVNCAFMVHRYRSGDTTLFVGASQYRLVESDGRIRIAEKRCKLDVDNLYEHGRISILL